MISKMLRCRSHHEPTDPNYWEKRAIVSDYVGEDFSRDFNMYSFIVSPWITAVETGNAERVQELLSQGANPYFMWYNFRVRYYTAMSFAISQGMPQLVRALLKGGTSPNRPIPSSESRQPRHPLVHAANKDSDACFALLLEHGASPNGNDALKLAVERQSYTRVKLLEDFGAEFDLETRRVAKESMWGIVYLKCMDGAKRVRVGRMNEWTVIPSSLLRGWRNVRVLRLGKGCVKLPLWLFKMKHLRLECEEADVFDLDSFYKKRNCYNAVVAVMLCCMRRKEDVLLLWIPRQVFEDIAWHVWMTRGDPVWKIV
jgi:hypothetical protein